MKTHFHRCIFLALVCFMSAFGQDGGLDISFNGSGKVTTALSANNNAAKSSALQSDGKIVIAGFASNGSNNDFAIARYNSDGSLDMSFNGTGKRILSIGSGYDEASGVAVQSDGKIVAAGYSWNGSNSDFTVVRFNSDGTLDTSFGGDGIVTTDINSDADEACGVAIQSDDKIVVVGYAYDGSNSDFAVVRYNSDGSLDDTFDGDGIVTTAIGTDSDEAKSIAIQSDGKIVVAGYSYNGTDGDVAVVRYDSSGSPDNAFGTNGIIVTDINSKYEEAYTVALQTDGKVVVAGYTDTESNGYDAFVLRYTAAGVLDNTFDGDGKVVTTLSSYDDPIRSIAIQSDGKIVAAGSTTEGSDMVIAVHRYNSNGSLDNTFGTNGIVTTSVNQDGNEANSILIQTDGKIVIAGYTTNAGNTDAALVRYIGNAGPGDLDITLNGSGKVMTAIGSGNAEIRSVALQPDGKIVAAGYGSNGANGDFAIARYTTAGALDITFNSNGKVLTAVGASSDEANGVAVQPDGKIVAAGYSWNGSNSDFAVVRYNSDGSLDNSFGGDGIVTTDIASESNEAYGVALQPDGKIVVIGYSYNGSDYDFAVVRYTTNGTLDNTFGGDGIVLTDVGGSDDEAKSILIQPDGKIVVAGYAHNGSDGDAAIVRYNSDGTLDTSFDSDGMAVTDIAGDYEEVFGIALQSDGKILATGYTSNGSDYDVFVLRYSAAGVLDNSFDTDGKVVTSVNSSDDLGQSIAVQSDGKFIVAGYSSNGNDLDFAILRYNSSGTLDNSFGTNGVLIAEYHSGQSDYATDLVIQPDSAIVVAGSGSDGSNDNFLLFRFIGDAGPLASLLYSSSAFTESGSNDGTIDNSTPVTIMLSGDTFTGSDNDNFVSAGKVTVSNLPSGLTAVVTRTSSTTVSVTLTGAAASHTAANSIANLTFAFQNSAFNNGNASAVMNATKSDLEITFNDPLTNYTLSFDGSDDVVSVPASSSINLSSQGTWEAWVYVSSLSHFHRVIFKEGDDGNGKYELYVLNNNFGADVVAGFTNTRYTVYASGITPEVNAWYHLAATYDGSSLNLYVNGILRGSMNAPGPITSNTGPLGIGGNISQSPSSLLEGKLDEVRIWNIVRTESEIAAAMNSELNGDETGLVLYYDCNEGSGTTLYDATTNGNNGTLLNGVVWNSGIISSIAYSTTIFNEAVTDSGSINNSSPLIITLTGIGMFTGNNNDEFVADGKLVVSNLPSGLSVVATRTSSTTLSVTINGKANNHKTSNNVSNVIFSLQNSAFLNNDAAAVLHSTKSDFQIRFVTVYNKNVYGTISFTKQSNADPSLAENQDRITDSVWITRNSSGGIYNRVTQTSGVPYDYYSPAGTKWAFGTTENYSSLTYYSFGGLIDGYNPAQLVGQNLVMHLTADDIYIDVKFTWWQDGGGGGFTYERSRTTFVVNYSSTIFRESAADNGAIDNSNPISITLVGDTLTGANGNDFVNDGKLTVTNLPSGLTAVATKTSATTLAVTITGNANNNNQVHNISNLTLTFGNSAFASGDASGVYNSTKNDLKIIFFGGDNNSLSFDGVNDYVHIPITTSPTAYTIEMWIKPADTTDAEIFVRTDNNGPNNAFSHQLNIRNRKFEHYTYDGNSYSVTGTTIIDAGTWYHVAITAQNNDVIRLFVNGIEEGVPFPIGTMWMGADRYYLGSYGAGLPNFAGLIDDIRIWNTVRTQSEIANNKESELRGTESGLLAYWNCNEGAGTILYDYSDCNYNSTLINGTAWSSNSPVTPLPVELVSFIASSHRLNAELRWKTATEVNNYGFEIEKKRMKDELGIMKWEKIGFVEGNGTTNAPKEYSFTDKHLSAGTYSYRLKQLDRDGQYGYSLSVEVIVGVVPKLFALEQNYPNPFNPSTTIGFTLQESGLTTLKIYDAIGREVATVVNENLEAGMYHQKTFDARNLSSGVYFAKLTSGGKSQLKKLMLMK